MLLLKKMLRDIRKLKWQFGAIFLVGAVGLFAFSGLDSFVSSTRDNVSQLYDQYQIPDYWALTSSLEEGDLVALSASSDVVDVETYLSFNVPSGDQRLQLNLIEDYRISLLQSIAGVPFDPDLEGLWLDYRFAKENDYQVGDSISLGGIALEIAGLVFSPERLFFINPYGLVPDYSRYGYAFIGARSAPPLPLAATHVVSIKLAREVDTFAFASTIDQIFGRRLIVSYDRANNPYISNIQMRLDQFDKFTYIFSLLFFLLSIVVSITTMRRLVDNQSIQIGTLMSQGYGRRQILFHYLSYSLLVSGLGSLCGLFVGWLVIPAIISRMFNKMFALPSWDCSISYLSIVAVLLITLLCGLSVYLSIKNNLGKQPAMILHRNSTHQGRRGRLLSRLPLCPRHRFVFSNMERSPLKSLMGIVGIAGTMMLVLAALGMKNSLDMTTARLSSQDYDYHLHIDQYAPSYQVVSSGISQEIETIRVTIEGRDEFIIGQATVYQDGELAYHQVDGRKLIPPASGVMIAKRLAWDLGLEVGDTLSFRPVLASWTTVQVTSIVDSPYPTSLLFSLPAWEQLGFTFSATSVIVKGPLDYVEGIDLIETRAEATRSVQEVFDSVNVIILIIIFVAVMLGVMTIYNLGLLNFHEMYRQYATLRVLGYRSAEIIIIALQENMILTLVGYLIGIPIGILFLDYYMNILSSLSVIFYVDLTLASFLYASLLTLVCSLATNYLLALRINKIDLSAALKSEE